MNDLIIKPGFFASLLRAVGLVKVNNDGKVEHDAGADFVEDTAFRSGYDPKAALSALAAFPWPYSCVQAISTDLSKVPLRAYRGRGSDAEVLDTHPILELLKQPSSRVSGVLFRRQLYTDLVLTGNAFVLMAGASGRIDALLRLHPARVQIAPLSDGQPDKYQYDSGSGVPTMYEHDVIMHIRGPSWSDDPSNLWGTGAVQPLHNDLTTEKAQAELAARTASTGQPTGILSPKEEGDRWSREQIKTLRGAYESQMRSGGSGVLILGGQAQFDKLQITPREMEFSQVRDFVRASTIAAFGCVPVRLGLETANYSQSRNQLQLYWESLQGRAALVDSELTRLARMYDEDVTIRHDFSEVESLQESRTERLNRVLSWSMMGVPLAEAAAYEGFDDLPIPADAPPVSTPADGEVEEPAATSGPESTDEPLAATALNGAQVASLLSVLAQVAMGAITFDAALALIGVAFPTIPESEARRILEGAQAVPTELDSTTEDEVDDELRWLVESVVTQAASDDGVWKRFVEKIQSPAEKKLQLATLRYLKGYAARIAGRLPAALGKKAVNGDMILRADGDEPWLDAILDSYTENQLMDDAFREPITQAYESAVAAATADMPSALAADFVFDHDAVDEAVNAQVGDLIGNISNSRRESVRTVVLDGLEAGSTINEIQDAIMIAQGFTASDALRIARTEATRSVNAAGVNAWEQMTEQAGVGIRFRWKAQPGARDSHAALNGEPRGDDGYWRIGNEKAKAPGQFGVAELDINCRCTYLPEVVI